MEREVLRNCCFLGDLNDNGAMMTMEWREDCAIEADESWSDFRGDYRSERAESVDAVAGFEGIGPEGLNEPPVERPGFAAAADGVAVGL